MQLTPECPYCDSIRIDTTVIDTKFKLGHQHDAPEISCQLPVRLCLDCGELFLDWEGEEAKIKAVESWLEGIV